MDGYTTSGTLPKVSDRPHLISKLADPSFFIRGFHQTCPTFSKLYLQAIQSWEKITCHDVIDHFETDVHYKWLLSNGTTRKRKAREAQIEDDDDAALVALMDGDRTRGRGRGGSRGGGGPGGRGGVRGRKRRVDERTMDWGAAKITFSTKKSGITVIQGTCHRKCTHKHLPGKPSTLCRQTWQVTENHSEEDCINLVKMWIGHANDYRSKQHHQAKRFGLDELVDDLESLKPPSGYNSEPDGAHPKVAARPKFRFRRKAAVDG